MTLCVARPRAKRRLGVAGRGIRRMGGCVQSSRFWVSYAACRTLLWLVTGPLVATPWTWVSTQTSLIAVGPCDKGDGMQRQCLADAWFALVRECFVQVLGAHAPVVPGRGSRISD